MLFLAYTKILNIRLFQIIFEHLTSLIIMCQCVIHIILSKDQQSEFEFI